MNSAHIYQPASESNISLVQARPEPRPFGFRVAKIGRTTFDVDQGESD